MYVLNRLGILLCLGLILTGLPQPAMGDETPATPEAPVQQESGKVEQPAKVEQLEQIEVLSFAEKAATSSVVTKEQMDLGPYQNMPGYLEEQTGVDLTRRSLLGVRGHQMSIRGFDESRYQVYLNGRSWKGAGVKGGFYVDWSTISPMDLERLELIRGPVSAEYPNTLGGVVTINTIRGSKEPKIYLDTYWGSWATTNYRLLHTGGYGPIQYSLGGSYGNSDGYLRNNFVRNRTNLEGSLTYTTPWETSITGQYRYITQDTGMIVYNKPNSPYYQSNEPKSLGDVLYGPAINFIGGNTGGINGLTYGNNSHVVSQRYELDFEAKQKFLYGEAQAHLFYFQAVREEWFYALNNPSQLIAKRGSWDEDTWGWNFKVRQSPAPVRLGFGLEGNYYGYGGLAYNYLNPNYVARPFPTSSSGVRNAQKIHGGFVDAAMPFWKYFELYLGLRYDNYDAAPSNLAATGSPVTYLQGFRTDALSPKSTLTIRPTDTTEMYLGANFSTRFPTLPEFYWFGAGYQPPGRTSSSVLLPEFGMQYEAGITQKLPYNALIKVRTYYYDINDYIRTIFGFRPSRVVYNINLALFRGVEVETQIGLPYDLTAYANLTWQKTSTSPDPLNGNIRELPELPEWKGHLGLKYTNPNGAEAKAYVRLVSTRAQPTAIVNTRTNTVTGVYLTSMNSFGTVNLEGRYPVGSLYGMKGFLYCGVQNLFSQFYEEDAGYPMPTATFYGGIQLRY
ncbi:MAG: TonB-dependent receptor plug domain-containing protein [Thermodesulfobacteriota bacterium]